MDLSPSLKLTMALHSNPGAYALLLGSGVSRAAGVPTGWEIVGDLSRRLAAGSGEEAPPDPVAWYQQKFQEPPTYARLLDRIATNPAERTALLKPYFEPTEEERESGLKLPTAAHRSIARLVRGGYVRMILTTNFDRLLESALEDEGIPADVISSDDALSGAVPYVHSSCVVAKLHGDFRDTRIKNTPEELAEYSPALNLFLDRVLDEFGLVVCGWSAEYDTALMNAILRCPTRRYSTYWLHRGEITKPAQDIISNRRAQEIPIDSADQVFGDVSEAIMSMEDLRRPHPDSIAVAVATVKRYLVDSQHRVRLHDLLSTETEGVYRALTTESLAAQPLGQPVTWEFCRDRLQRYEACTDRLLPMTEAIGYHDEGGNAYLLRQTIERLCEFSEGSGVVLLLSMQFYPALLTLYSAGIAAVAGRRFRNLAALLIEPQSHDSYGRGAKPSIRKLNPWEVFTDPGKFVPIENAERRHTPGSDYLYDLLRHSLTDYARGETAYQTAFDTFEFLLALTYHDVVDRGWSPVGRFGWRYKDLDPGAELSPPEDFIRRNQSELLGAGFFSGTESRLEEVLKAHDELVKENTRGWI